MLGMGTLIMLSGLVSCSYNYGYNEEYYNESDNCCNNRYDAYPIERYYEDNEYRQSWNFQVFVNKTIHTFHHEFKATDCELLKCILYYIWQYIGHHDRNKLALFVASSLHDTSFYKIFATRHSDERYKSRGLLMIKGYDNYVHLTTISASNNDYVSYPDLLALPRYDTIGDTIKFWEERLRGCYTFENMMESFRIESYYINKHNPDIENWRNMYKKLKHAYYECN